MSIAEVERFAKTVKTDTSLQEELKANSGDEAAVANLAKGKGYDFTAEELKSFAAGKKGELSEDQLDKIAGGGDTTVVAVVVDVVVV